ncbi:carboxypeptidase-like regulatory domain-containing protein [uncultured Flavobacterium sp.]|uniref:carboxypeptidase-like regulatory domain-containing protein n=1 Tax=uncultured Flavobacterium sp. TaxID=165435 RepID=UPI0025F360F9|nr:carboxypeptidase-like regulatory domain-containing protein [uncultured Flavobacterium sp.]
MKTPIQLSITNPCHENWDAMTPADKGRFCASCQKNVRDFTNASDREILEALRTGGQACGRFRASQLNRELAVPKEKSRFWAAASAAAITLVTLGVNELAAQTPPNIEQQQRRNENDKPDSIKVISGMVNDEYGNPVPGVNVKVKGVSNGVQTDFDGLFTIPAEEGDTLEFAYAWMIPQEIKVSEVATSPIILCDEPTTLEDIIVGSYSYGDWLRGVAREFMFVY